MAKREEFQVSLHPASLCDLEQVSVPLWASVSSLANLEGWSTSLSML